MSENIQKTESKQRQLAGLKPFKKGQSGNPKGRPKGTVSITAEIRAKLLKIYPEKQATVIGDDGKKIKKEKKTYLEMLIKSIFENAIKNKDTRMLNQIWAYIDGQPKATLDIGADKSSLEELTTMFRAMATPAKNPNGNSNPTRSQ